MRIHVRQALVALGFALVVLAIYSQSYAGRVNLVRDLRRSCEETALRLVNDANNLRGDIASESAAAKANRVVANDPFQSAVTRGARMAQAGSEDHAVELKRQELRVMDQQIDRGDWALLATPADQEAVRVGERIRTGRGVAYLSPFRCESAFPWPSPVEFFR